MLHTLLGLLPFALTVSAALGVYLFARSFVRHRLRFVDAVRSPFAPIAAGAIAFAVALPFALLPFITQFTAAAVGVAAGFGTASGVRSLGRWEASRGRLNP
ncbi:MAG: hypothetical protein MUC69_09405 [Gemmatimonadales bacterium]|jgi:uncharacterized membrane protein|nr:hypothetical protein [Gemmatimonadales bacterium]